MGPVGDRHHRLGDARRGLLNAESEPTAEENDLHASLKIVAKSLDVIEGRRLIAKDASCSYSRAGKRAAVPKPQQATSHEGICGWIEPVLRKRLPVSPPPLATARAPIPQPRASQRRERPTILERRCSRLPPTR